MGLKKFVEFLKQKDEDNAIEEINSFRYLTKRVPCGVPAKMMHKAVKHGSVRCAKKLSKTWPCVVDMPNDSGDTPLHVAVHKNDAKMIRALHELGTRAMYWEAGYGRTPIESAIVMKNTDAMNELISIDSNLTYKAVKSRYGAVGMAIKYSCASQLYDLYNHDPAMFTRVMPFTLFHFAFYSRRIVSVPTIVALCTLISFRIDCIDDFRMSPLHACVSHQTTRYRILIAILHSYGSTSHFKISSHPDAPKPATHPQEYRFIRRLYFSRSLSEVLFFTPDADENRTHRH